MKNVILVTLVFLFLLSCEKPIYCTEEFRTIVLEVNGITLTESYTVNTENNDTIRIDSWGGNLYAILDDSYKNSINENPSSFQFYGFVNDSLWVNETYQIKSDGCHIIKVSGETVINF
jgi:hypothetical protein